MRNTVLVEFAMPLRHEFTQVKHLAQLPEYSTSGFISASSPYHMALSLELRREVSARKLI